MPTYGSPSPSQLILNFDDVFSTSLINARKTLTDNISNSNPFFYEMKRKGMYETTDGGSLIQEDLLYALAPTDSYDGFDQLSTTPTDGITAAFYEWRQTATPIAYSGKEKKMNKHRIIDFITAKIKQAELGAIEFFAKSLFHGNGPGALSSPRVSPSNGSLSCDPLWKIIQVNPTVPDFVGNIDQSTNPWWRNRTKDFTGVTTYQQFLNAVLNLYNTCAIGPGGPPDLIICDQITYELWNAAYYAVYRRQADSDNNYPFENILFRNAIVVWDENFPNLGAGTLDPSAPNGGGMAMINTKFMKIRYESETDFIQTPPVRPANQDVYVSHILWMGNITCNNRRKLGVGFNIPRTLS